MTRTSLDSCDCPGRRDDCFPSKLCQMAFHASRTSSDNVVSGPRRVLNPHLY